MLGVPGEEVIAAHLAQTGHVPDPDAIRAAREAAIEAIAQRFAAEFQALVSAHGATGPFRPDAGSAGRRALRNTALAFLARTDGGRAARAAFAAADNMTDSLGALVALMRIGAGEAELAAFYARWRGDRLVMDQWFALQALHAAPEGAAATVARLAEHPDFDWTNPNRFRALFGSFAANPAAFHRADGSGYELMADWLIRLDGRNPQFAARMSTAFESWRRYDAGRQARARAALERIAGHAGLSRNMAEMTSRMLGTAA
jgi:aminopeptidase N